MTLPGAPGFYLVGGAVRDQLLGLPVEERDWVVVGATERQMLELGYQRLDAEFPVFRHPRSGEEYALARRETKHGEGYRGFVVDAGPDVTLHDDLRRRDLTINAMALGDDQVLVDPYGGREDLDAGLLRHVSPAFVEDPLRVLRVARFAAKLGRFGFRVAHGTYRLMCAMVERGDMHHLKPERVWRETFKAMRGDQPWRYFEVLHRCGALAELMPPIAALMGDAPTHADAPDAAPVMALKRVTRQCPQAEVRSASVLAACLDSQDDVETWLQRLRVDRATADLLRRVVDARGLVDEARKRQPVALCELVRRWRGLAAPEAAMLAAAVVDAQYGDRVLSDLLRLAVSAARSVSVDELRARGVEGRALGEALERERELAIAAAL